MEQRKFRQMLLALCSDCLYHAKKALDTSTDSFPLAARTMHMSQAYTAIALAQFHYAVQCEEGEIPRFEAFHEKFRELHSEFAEAIETDHGLQWSMIFVGELTELHTELQG